jgi:signal transduction histidine kinase
MNTGIGITVMQERLRLLGGQLIISTGRSEGTQLKASIPLKSA